MFKINDKDHKDCLNCGSALTGEFCSNCGQKKINPYHTFWYLVQEFLGNYISFDSKFIKTIRPLVFKPGFLTNEYRLGRRTLYIPPIRLYVFISIVFFLVFINIRKPELNVGFTSPDVLNEEAIAALDSVYGIAAEDSIVITDLNSIIENIDSFTVFDQTFPKFDNLKEFETYRDSLPVSEKPGWLSRIIIRQSIKMSSTDPDEMNKAVVGQFLDNLPKVIFILLPVFALIFKLLYIRGKYFYEEHFIFSIHFHAFLFIMFLFMIPLSFIWQGIWILALVIPAIYLFFAMRAVYNQSKAKTLFKLTSVMFMYLIVLIFAFGINIVISAFTV